MLKLPLIALFFVLNPYLGIPSVFPSDIQPVAILICLVYFRFHTGRAKIAIYILFFIALISTCLAFAYALSTSYDFSLMDLIRDVFPFIAPPIYLGAGISLLRKKIIRSEFPLLIKSFIVLYLFGAFLNLAGWSSFIQLIVSRAESHGFGARGLTSFFPEPSRISEQALLIFYLSVYFRLHLKRSLYLSLFAVTIMAGSGQTLVVYFQLFLSSVIAYGKQILKAFLFQLSSLRINSVALVGMFTLSASIALFIATNSQTRGFRAVHSIVSVGPQYIASDLGIQIKLSGLKGTISSFSEVSPFFHFPKLVLESRPDFLATYNRLFMTLFGVQEAPLLENIYSTFGQYSIAFGLIGSIAIAIVLGLAAAPFFNFKSVADEKKVRFIFLFFLMLFFGMVKVPAANPAAWFMLAVFFIESASKKMAS